MMLPEKKSFKAPTMSEAVRKSETVRSCGSKDRNENAILNVLNLWFSLIITQVIKQHTCT